MKLTHVSSGSEAKMVDISRKSILRREALACGRISMKNETISLIEKHQIQKGEVLAVARVAAINGAKKTSDLIPLCHNILIDHIDVEFTLHEGSIEIMASATCEGKTGIEMEALTAVSIAALTIYDMCKAVDRDMMIGEIKLKRKTKSEIHR